MPLPVTEDVVVDESVTELVTELVTVALFEDENEGDALDTLVAEVVLVGELTADGVAITVDVTDAVDVTVMDVETVDEREGIPVTEDDVDVVTDTVIVEEIDADAVVDAVPEEETDVVRVIATVLVAVVLPVADLQPVVEGEVVRLEMAEAVTLALDERVPPPLAFAAVPVADTDGLRVYVAEDEELPEMEALCDDVALTHVDALAVVVPETVGDTDTELEGDDTAERVPVEDGDPL